MIEEKKPVAIPIRGDSPLKLAGKRLMRNRLAGFALLIILALVVLAVGAQWIAPQDPNKINLLRRYKAPSAENLLGTDELGRDVLSRLIYGTQASLLVGLGSTTVSIVIGVLLGALAGYYGGWIDQVVMRSVDIVMCFPFFLMAIVIAAILGPSIGTVVFVSGILGWPSLARMVRAEVLSLRQREFVEAARALGLTSMKIITSHIIPNIFSVVVVYATLGIAGGILGEAGLSYLGLGVKQPQPSWGNMISAAQNMTVIQFYPWMWVPPGLMILIVVLAINIFGDALRDALDPKQKV